MPAFILVALVLAFAPTGAAAQVMAGLSYGVDRNVDSPPAETDGWANATVEWMVSPGFGMGIGVDLQYEGAPAGPSGLLGGAVYLSTSMEHPLGSVAPFVRGGIGIGRAPCEGDTCSDGLYLRGSSGLRIRIRERLRLTGEIGVSRVSRPFGGVGVSVLF